jgi:uncharacterized protein (DUF2147 family)
MRIKKFPFCLVYVFVMIVSTGSLGAAELSPAGLWRIIDDRTGKARGLVRIREVNGEYEGKIEKIFPKPGDDPTPRCEKCDGVRYNQPVLGLTFIWGLKKQGDEYQDGEILDPETGKTYRAKIRLIDGGRKLEVRGFIGVSVFGRSQTWLRAE